MSKIRIVRDLDECAFLWRSHYPVDSLFDLWQVRKTFSQIYGRENCFIVHEEDGKVNGLLPLCRITEPVLVNESSHFPESCLIKKESFVDGTNHPYQLSTPSRTVDFAFFPGELWKSRTWMEQNKIIAANSRIMVEMLGAVPGNADIRYLCKESLLDIPPEFTSSLTVDKTMFCNTEDAVDNATADIDGKLNVEETASNSLDRDINCAVDETGYLFYPGNHGYQYEQYLGAFAGKSRKKILSEVRSLQKQRVSFRYNNLEDVESLFQLNIDNFGEHGYFHDPRFLNAFIQLAHFLHKQGMLRVVTVVIDDEIAAVDMGAMWNNSCTMVAGGTSKKFPGVAKLINLHHMEWACAQKVACIDFLCGDFGWKGRFHLTPRPLYQINIDTHGR